MDHFYFVRHGQTDANLQGLMCGGAWDIPLNQTGINQAQEAGAKLKSHAGQVSSICCSPLIRAKKTAEIIAEQYGLSPKPIDELREWQMGDWDRQPFELMKEAFLGTDEPANGETRQQMHDRITSAFTKCRAHDHQLIIVSHGGVWMTLQKILGLTPARSANGVPFHVFRGNDQKWMVEQL